LDSGAATSDLWPKFADVASDLVRKSGTHESHTIIGMGGTRSSRPRSSQKKVVLDLGGMSVALQPAHILKSQQRDAGKWFYGNLAARDRSTSAGTKSHHRFQDDDSATGQRHGPSHPSKMMPADTCLADRVLTLTCSRLIALMTPESF
jgi:hypothetical protein